MRTRHDGWHFLIFAAALCAGCSEKSASTDSTPPTASSAATEPRDSDGLEAVSVVEHVLGDDDTLKQRLDAAIRQVRSRHLITTNAFWTIFHGMLGLGPNVPLLDEKTGESIPALQYLFAGEFPHGEIRGAKFLPTADGLDVTIGPVHVGQGHQDQFVAEMVEWGVPIDTPVVVYGKKYAFRDFVNESMARARVGQGQELSWAIVVIGDYVGTDSEWTNRFGEKLHFEDLMRDEVDASVTEAACGGTHRLYGLTWALGCHLRNGGKIERVWKDVSDKLEEHVTLARQYQNPDGSFSSEYFAGPGTSNNLQERLASSGHIFEWLAQHVTDDQLREEWMQNGAMAVSLMILDASDRAMESGALYHATHGLVTYRKRLYGSGFPK